MIRLTKANTPPTVYKQTFSSLVDHFTKNKWNFLFTDGSKSSVSTTFAAIHQNGDIIETGHINNYCINFTAEALAILKAVKYAENQKSKFIICTDSLSSIQAICNTNYDSQLINEIRNCLIKSSNKINLLWVTSYVGILGNELADAAASEAKNRPLFKYSTWENNDIRNVISSFINNLHDSNWSNYLHSYKNVNPLGRKPSYPKTC